jgi:hypothetical protein
MSALRTSGCSGNKAGVCDLDRGPLPRRPTSCVRWRGRQDIVETCTTSTCVRHQPSHPLVSSSGPRPARRRVPPLRASSSIVARREERPLQCFESFVVRQPDVHGSPQGRGLRRSGTSRSARSSRPPMAHRRRLRPCCRARTDEVERGARADGQPEEIGSQVVIVRLRADPCFHTPRGSNKATPACGEHTAY